MQQPQKGASTQSTWLVLHSSWICAESMLRWLAHPRLQPGPASGRRAKHSRGGQVPLPCAHGRSSHQSAQCGCHEPILEWLHSQQCGHELAYDDLLTGWGLLPAAGQKGDMDNLEIPLASGLIPSCAATCMGGPKLVLYELALAQPRSVPGEEHGARSNRLPGCLSPAPRNTTTHCYGYTRFDSQLRASSGTAKSAPSDHRINPARAAHQQWLLPIQLFPCTSLPPLPLTAEQNHWVQCT